MAQTQRINGVATNVATDSTGTTNVRYHATDVVSFNNDSIKLRTGGWRTATTKLRMNQAANQFGLGFCVSQRDGDWFVSFKGKEIPFDDQILILHRRSA